MILDLFTNVFYAICKKKFSGIFLLLHWKTITAIAIYIGLLFTESPAVLLKFIYFINEVRKLEKSVTVIVHRLIRTHFKQLDIANNVNSFNSLKYIENMSINLTSYSAFLYVDKKKTFKFPICTHIFQSEFSQTAIMAKDSNLLSV